MTGATAYNLTSVEVGFADADFQRGTSRNLTVSIWTADGSDEPDSKLVDLTLPSAISGCGNAPQPVVPMANTTSAIPERRWYIQRCIANDAVGKHALFRQAVLQ